MKLALNRPAGLMASIEFVNRLKPMNPYDRRGPDPLSLKMTAAVGAARDQSLLDESLRPCCGPLVRAPHDSALRHRPSGGESL